MKSSNVESLENYIKTTTQLFASTTQDAILSYDLASLDTFIEEILKNEGVIYARIFDNNKQLLSKKNQNNYIESPFEFDENYHSVTDDIFDTSINITIDNVVYGNIEMGFSTHQINESLSEARKLAGIIAAIEMVLVALFSFILGCYLTHNLRKLKIASKKVALGDLSHNLNIRSNDEIGEVTKAFNTMITSLKHAEENNQKFQQDLMGLNQSLEEKVKNRTEKIIEQKDKLQSAYDQLQTTQAQLVQSEKMASIGQLAAGVAHEINNPVAYVKSNINSLEKYIEQYRSLLQHHNRLIHAISENNHFSELISIKSDIEKFKQEEDFDFIESDINELIKESSDGINRVQDIVRGLKDYSRTADEVMEPIDINQCLESTLKMLGNELKYKCEIDLDLRKIPSINGNTSKLAQVFTNLIVNANHAIKEQGKLSITTKHEQSSGLDHVVITIGDNGKGISKEHLPKLFDPFFTTKPVGEGTGLGLAICLGIINDHLGAIEVDSKEGEGTTFTITIPCVETN